MTEPKISFRVWPKNPHQHLFGVECRIKEPNRQGQMISFPTWIPGSYLIREFARHVVTIEAHNAQGALRLQKMQKNTWHCQPSDSVLTISYDVYAFDPSIRGAYLDQNQGFFNGTSIFVKALGFENASHEVTLEAEKSFPDWKVATSMVQRDVNNNGFGTYVAKSYDELVDHPVQMGPLQTLPFDVENIPHQFAWVGEQQIDGERLIRDAQKLCRSQIRFFGPRAPFDRYVFIVKPEDDAYGGLEHGSSSVLACKRNDLPRPNDPDMRDSYRTFLGLLSHEYFHAWNVKRIRPQALKPIDYNQENYTRLLWFFEGVTSYYDDLFLVRSDLISTQSYLELLGRTMTRVERNTGRFKQSLAESSFDTWIKFYRPDENTPNSGVSYYAKGSLVALALDLTIRSQTSGEKSLDDVMKAVWNQFGKTDVGVGEFDIEQIAQSISGIDLRAFFALAIDSTEDLALTALFPQVGVRALTRAPESDKDEGGTPPKKPKEANSRKPYFGAKWKMESDTSVMITHVPEGSPAELAGIAANDIISAMDGWRVTPANFESVLARYDVGQIVKINGFRRHRFYETSLHLTEVPKNTWYLELDPQATDEALAMRNAWLSPSPNESERAKAAKEASNEKQS